MSDPEGTDRPAGRRRMPWPTLVVLGLALFGAISLVQFVVGAAFTLAKLLIIVAIVAVLVVFFRGPPAK
jgi:hypothetical protein